MSLDTFVGPRECLAPPESRVRLRGLRSLHLSDRAAGTPVDAASHRWSRPLRSVPARLGMSVGGGTLVAVLAEVPGVLTACVLTIWTMVHAHRATRAGRTVAALPRGATVMTALLAPVALVGLSVAYAGVGQRALAQTVVVLVAATALFLLTAAVAHATRSPLRVLVVGDRAAAGDVAADWARRDRIDVVGTVLVGPETERRTRDPETHGAAVTDPAELPGRVAEWAADLVVAVPSQHFGPTDLQRLSWALEKSGAALAVATALDSVAPHRLAVSSIAGCAVAQVGPSRPPAYVRAVKSLVDRLVGILLLLLTTPLLAAMVVLVRLDSPGPGLFSQTRVGRNGAPFVMFKMRTMCAQADHLKPGLAAADEGNGVLFKVRSDPRITRVGRLLRKTSLDELPQLINVVRGEMSLVGPRPGLPEEVVRYEDTARRRLTVRPGITGLWQVNGRSDLDWDTTVALDTQYTDNITISRDLLICLRTIGAVASGRGAY